MREVPTQRPDSADAETALAGGEFLAGLPSAVARGLAAHATVRTLRRGDRLWDHGAPSAALAIVASGRVKCWSAGRDARQWVNAIARPGGVCGLAACVDGGPYTCTADALERSRVAFVPAAELRAAIEESPPLASAVARTLARDARRLLAVCEDVALRTPLERLARYLAGRAAGGSEIELVDTQTQIAAQLGTVREVVARALHELCRRGVISRTGRVIHVLRPAELGAVAESAVGA